MFKYCLARSTAYFFLINQFCNRFKWWNVFTFFYQMKESEPDLISQWSCDVDYILYIYKQRLSQIIRRLPRKISHITTSVKNAKGNIFRDKTCIFSFLAFLNINILVSPRYCIQLFLNIRQEYLLHNCCFFVWMIFIFSLILLWSTNRFKIINNYSNCNCYKTQRL